MMSLSVMSPAPSSRTLSRISSWSSCSSAWVIAPSEPGHVRLEDDPQLLGLAGLDLAVEVLEGRAAAALAALGGGLRPCGSRPSCGLPSRRRRRAGCRRPAGTSARPRTTTARRRAGLGDPLALVVLERADAAERLADDDDVADLERARSGRARSRPGRGPCRAAPRRSCRRRSRFGLALSSWRSATSRIISISSSRPGRVLAETGHERHVAAVLLDDDAGLGQLGLDPVRVGVRLVDLVERDDDRHLGRLGVADRLERLGHDPVVGRDHDDRDVGDPGAAGAHRGERLVARRVEEDDALAVVGDLARADVLGDAAALAGRDLGRPDARRAGSSCRGRRGP